MMRNLKILRQTKRKLTCLSPHSTESDNYSCLKTISIVIHIFKFQALCSEKKNKFFIENFQKLKSDATPENMQVGQKKCSISFPTLYITIFQLRQISSFGIIFLYFYNSKNNITYFSSCVSKINKIKCRTPHFRSTVRCS